MNMLICNLCNETVDVNADFIREAKHARDVHLTSSLNGQLQFQYSKPLSKAKLLLAVNKLFAHVVMA